MGDSDGDMVRNGSEEDGNVRSDCEEYEGTDCEETLIGKDRQNVTCFVY